MEELEPRLLFSADLPGVLAQSGLLGDDPDVVTPPSPGPGPTPEPEPEPGPVPVPTGDGGDGDIDLGGGDPGDGDNPSPEEKPVRRLFNPMDSTGDD